MVNDSRVVPARIPIERPRGEVLLLSASSGDEWEALARPTRRLRAGQRFTTGSGELSCSPISAGALARAARGEPAGAVPLPPYITTPLADLDRYQTVYARESGSAAAPTAGCTSRRSCSRGSTPSA